MLNKLENLLYNFWHYEPFWKWYCRLVILSVTLGWILIITKIINNN